MTACQKRKNREIQEKVPGHRLRIYRSFQELARLGLELQQKSRYPSLRLITDEHPWYARVIHDLSGNETDGVIHSGLCMDLSYPHGSEHCIRLTEPGQFFQDYP